MHEVCHKVAVESFPLSLKDPLYDPVVGWLYSPGGLAGAEAVVVAVGHVMVLCLRVSSDFPKQNIKLNENQKYPKLI